MLSLNDYEGDRQQPNKMKINDCSEINVNTAMDGKKQERLWVACLSDEPLKPCRVTLGTRHSHKAFDITSIFHQNRGKLHGLGSLQQGIIYLKRCKKKDEQSKLTLKYI